MGATVVKAPRACPALNFQDFRPCRTKHFLRILSSSLLPCFVVEDAEALGHPSAEARSWDLGLSPCS